MFQDLSSASVSIAAAVLVAAWLTARAIWLWHRLRHVPGPALAGFSSLWLIRKQSSGRFCEHMRDASEKYGPLVRIGPNDLLCSDPETLRRMSAVRSPYTKGIFYETGRIIPGYDNVVSERDEVRHKALRAKMASAYSSKDVSRSALEASVDLQLEQLIALIDAKYVSNGGAFRPLDLSTKAQYFVLDVISHISFSEAFGFLREDRDLYQYIEINNAAVPVMNLMQTMPWLTGILYRWPFRLALPSDGDKVGFGRLMGVAKACVERRLQSGVKPRHDMLESFINGGMTYDELIQHMFVQIVAGSITTAAAVRHTLLALISSPAVYRTLQREIDDNIAAGRISRPFITDWEAHAMPYLQAVIHEGLRMWPPTTGLGSKEVPATGDTLCNMFIPGGTQVSHNFFGVMRSKSIWGEDADVFRPERWLVTSVEEESRVKMMNSIVDTCFGSGKYQCLGKPLAMMELNKIFVELLRRYDFAMVDPQRPIDSTSGVFWVAPEMWVRVTRRA